MQFRIIKTDGEASLVEFSQDGETRRSVVPCGLESNVEALEAGIQYGIDWQKLFEEVEPDYERLANSFRNRGLWTFEDMLANPGKAKAALQDFIGVSYQTLLRIAKREVK